MEKTGENRENVKALVWYVLCFLVLGLIDQRRGSAGGTTQLTMVNLLGLVVAALLLPSLDKAFLRFRGMWIWTGFSLVLGPVICVLGSKWWYYPGQWCTGVLNVVLAGYLVLYVIWKRQEIRSRNRVHMGWFLVIMVMLVLMQLSVHEALWPGWFAVMFGSFYLIGIPEKLEGVFCKGFLLGMILWFLIQQTIAFAFRPYDYVRYRGLYSGETQNGLFYMVAFCAFFSAWLLLKKQEGKKPLKVFCFLMAAGCVGLILLTGGRSSLVGAVAAGALGFILYDIIICRSFRHWLIQGIVFGMCVVLLFPAVYGCVRYLPTVLHHPIWFVGEYNPKTSVHSYDPWDSEKYITFQEAAETSVGRVLQMFSAEPGGKKDETDGLDGAGGRAGSTDGKAGGTGSKTDNTGFAGDRDGSADGAGSTDGKAGSTDGTGSVGGRPGSSPDNPFMLEGTDEENSISIRKNVYTYYARNLNLKGHRKEEAVYYMSPKLHYYHAHNMFLQIGFDYGIPAGILFLVWNLWCVVRLLRRRDNTGIVCVVFMAAIVIYGCTEMAVMIGQITLSLLFGIYYFALRRIPKTN